MIGRLVKDESGMTMSLAVIMVVLIGVMGAGLLTFVSTDLNAVVEVNQGQKALEVADAGIASAKRQLISDTDPLNHYDGGSDDLPWSYCYGVAGCTSFSPTPGSAGMTLNMSAGSAQVTVLTTSYSPGTFKVISTGCIPNCASSRSKRKIEALFRSHPQVGFPATYFSRQDLTIGGSANPTGVSFFAMRDASTSNSLGTVNDQRYGKWASTTGGPPYPNASGSYPNSYNAAARGSFLPGLGALRTVSGSGAAAGSRSYGSNTCPQMVQDYYADSPTLPCIQKMSFPFEIPTAAKDKQQIDALRNQALNTETPTNPRYFDSIPGNKVDDPGRPNGALTINPWPAPGSTFSTVVFYDYNTYNTSNVVTYSPPGEAAPCSSAAPQGLIVVQNGDANMAGNRGFNGGIITRAYDASGNLITTGGKFTSSGSACLRGYANSGGLMTITGNFSPSDAPTLGSLDAFKGSLEMVSWRELYQ